MTNLEKALVLIEQASWLTAGEGSLNPSWLSINTAENVLKVEIEKEKQGATDIPSNSPD